MCTDPSVLELRVPFLRLPACSAPTLGPRRHGAVPISAPRLFAASPLFARFTTYMPPLADSPLLTYEHLRSPVLRSHSDVDGRAAVCVEEDRTPSRQREKAEKVLRAIGARP